MHEIVLAHLDKTRPVLVLTREIARPAMSRVTVAPITSTVKGLSTELPLGVDNGLDHECCAAIDNVVTVPAAALGRVIGHLLPNQEIELANAVVLAFDLDLPVRAANRT